MNRFMIALVVAAAVAIPAGGCANRNAGNPGSPGESTSVLNNSLLGANSTESGLPAKDPAINAQTHFAAGTLAESQGNYEGAARQYEMACKLDKNYLLAIYRLGVTYSHLNDWARAVETWKSYVDVTNGVASAWGNLGFCYELAGDAANAEMAYQKGIARDPICQPCRVNYGLMLARRSRVKEATEQFAAVLTPAEVHYNLASIYEQQGLARKAREEYDLALRLDPNLMDARMRLAAIDVSE